MTFQREDRYIVIKRKDLAKVSPTDGDLVQSYLQHIRAILDDWGVANRQYLVIENDWPEYEPAWAMIEARMSGAPPAQPCTTVLSPDDQAEIDRLHAEFIAIDEPNNEQVMAFQDASYALGLKRGQAREAALQQRLDTAEHQREQLAQAIADATHKAGIVADGAALDGPTLLMVLNDFVECQLATQKRLSEADQRIDELATANEILAEGLRIIATARAAASLAHVRTLAKHALNKCHGFLSQLTKDSPEVGS